MRNLITIGLSILTTVVLWSCAGSKGSEPEASPKAQDSTSGVAAKLTERLKRRQEPAQALGPSVDVLMQALDCRPPTQQVDHVSEQTKTISKVCQSADGSRHGPALLVDFHGNWLAQKTYHNNAAKGCEVLLPDEPLEPEPSIEAFLADCP